MMEVKNQQEKEIRRGVIGRGERFCKGGVCLSRDEDGDEDEDGKVGKRGWWEDQGVKRGDRGEGRWWLLVGYLPNLYLSPSYTL